jgi:hypothetical protein
MNLTPEQLQALDQGQPVLVTLAGRECVLLSKGRFTQMKSNSDEDTLDYDPWTQEEMNLLADEAAELLAEDGLDEWETPSVNHEPPAR